MARTDPIAPTAQPTIPLTCTSCWRVIGDALDPRIDVAMANHRCTPRLRLRWPWARS
jgi:hypothetical protein